MRACAIVFLVFLGTTAGSASLAPESIVYGRQGDLWLTTLGGGSHLLVGGEGADELPAWAPDGRRIAFVRSRFDPADPDVLESMGVWIAGADGRRRQSVTRGRGASDPAWSPDGRRLAWVKGDGVYLSRWDGTHRVRIVFRADPSAPSWSRDGRRIAFVVSTELRLVDAGGTHQRLLARGVDGDSAPAWSPDGRRVAFTSRAGVSVVSSTGGRPKLLARGYQSPAWSPHGRSIAVVRRGVFLVPASGGSPRRLTRGADTEVTWSPDSRRLAFVRGTIAGDIYVVDATGSGLRNLTRTPRLDERNPAWRPRSS
jgi:TolB protein